MEFIPGAGACLAIRSIIERKGLVHWIVRGESKAPTDNGWQVMSYIDTSEYFNDTSNWQIVNLDDLRAIEPTLIDIWDLSVGSDLQIMRDELGTRIVGTPTGREIPVENLYVPPSQRVE